MIVRRARGLGATGLAMILLLPLADRALARDLFTIDVTVDEDVREVRGFDSFEDVVDLVEEDAFARVNAAYTDTSIGRALIDLRGVELRAAFPSAGPEIEFSVPAVGFTQAFDDRDTREGNTRDLVEFLEDNGEDLLTDVLGELVASSPVDPVAGNPNSLQSTMVAADFAMGTTVGPGNGFAAEAGATAGEEGESAPNLIGLQARFGRFTSDGLDTNVIDLPISYVVPLADPRYAVILDAPLTFVETEGARSYAGSLGVGVRVPVLDNWSLTPALRSGATGSVEAGAAAVLLSGSLTSNFEVSLFGVDLTLGNGVSYIRSLPLAFGDYDVDYELDNVVLRNGIGLSGGTGVDLFGEPVTWEAAAVNTQFLGDELFVENATDLSVSVGTEASETGLVWDSVRLGVTYTLTDSDYRGFRLNFGYQF